MRVVAGRLRGRRLVMPAGAVTRPTADRVREAIFSILGDVSGLRVLDLFAGSGALGIEALSRGACELDLVDQDRCAATAIERNLSGLGLEARSHRREVVAWLDAQPAGRTFELVFCDPPYDSAARLAAPLAERLPQILDREARIVTESHKRTPLELPLPLLRERTYGDTRIAVHRAG
ncbi:MAG: 16S rRNA (guanine(966)-N(2))-methyltransferase RsmD [Thermoleophilaceae bacterium]